MQSKHRIAPQDLMRLLNVRSVMPNAWQHFFGRMSPRRWRQAQQWGVADGQH
jgi:hypothetical protein